MLLFVPVVINSIIKTNALVFKECPVGGKSSSLQDSVSSKKGEKMYHFFVQQLAKKSTMLVSISFRNMCNAEQHFNVFLNSLFLKFLCVS